MRSNIAFWGLVLATATGFTTGFYFLDRKFALQRDQAAAERWSRQVIDQVSSLSLHGRLENLEDSLSWASRLLSQGTDPRLLSVKKIKLSASNSEELKFEEPGRFTYSQVLSPETGEGVEIQILRPYRGFLGASNRLKSDLLFGFIWAGWILLSLLMGHVMPKSAAAIPQETPASSNDKETQIRAWLHSAKSWLIDWGAIVKNLSQDFKDLQTLVESQKKTLLEFHDELHQELTELRGINRQLEILAKAQVESPLHEHLANLAQRIAARERELEKRVMDADLALQKALPGESSLVSEHFKSATQSLLKQARDLKSALAA